MSQLFDEESAQVFWESVFIAAIRAGQDEMRAGLMADNADRKRAVRLRAITNREQAAARNQLKAGE